MKLYRVRAVAHKELLHVWRDARSMGFAVAIPMLMLILFGYALTLDVDNVPLVVWDQSQTPASRKLVSHFVDSRYFSLQGQISSYTQAEEAIDTGRARAALIIPSEFAHRLEARQAAAVQFLLDGSDANSAAITRGYAESITQTFSNEIRLREVRRLFPQPPREPLDFRPRVWFNAELKSKNFIVPGLIALIMMVLAALLTSLTFSREWENGTMEQLISTPVKSTELVLGKLVPYFIIGVFDVLIAMFMGAFVFKVPLRGSVLLLFGLSAIFLVGALSMGMFISIATKSQLLSNQLSMMITYMPSILLSGLIFTIQNMPLPLKMLTYVTPARYFITVLRGIYLKGLGLPSLWLEVLLMLVFSLVMVTLCMVKFRKKLE